MRTVLFVLLGTALGVVVVAWALPFVWRAVGNYRINRAGPRPLRPAQHLIWRDPGPASTLDLGDGPGGSDGAPTPPFRFLEEHTSGSQPCISIMDGRSRRWRVKWGEEVRSENFAVRLAWACGYFAEITYFVESGVVEGAHDLQRASGCLDSECRFRDARFERDDPAVKKLFEEHGWSWDDNPFVGTKELNGLKILVMLLSNWDTKDRRDVARGSNTAIFEYRISRWRREARYLITDWGGSMGRWGSNIVTRGRWDARGFEAQTPQFVTGVDNGIVRFGYTGQRTADVAHDISRDDVRWLLRYIGALSDAQVRDALLASGATGEEADRFTRAIRSRIGQLGRVAAAAAP